LLGTLNPIHSRDKFIKVEIKKSFLKVDGRIGILKNDDMSASRSVEIVFFRPALKLSVFMSQIASATQTWSNKK